MPPKSCRRIFHEDAPPTLSSSFFSPPSRVYYASRPRRLPPPPAFALSGLSSQRGASEERAEEAKCEPAAAAASRRGERARGLRCVASRRQRMKDGQTAASVREERPAAPWRHRGLLHFDPPTSQRDMYSTSRIENSHVVFGGTATGRL